MEWEGRGPEGGSSGRKSRWGEGTSRKRRVSAGDGGLKGWYWRRFFMNQFFPISRIKSSI
jgi:hypothetical protein